MVAYDKHDYFYLGIIITGSLLALLALLLTVIKPDFEKPTFIGRFIDYGRDTLDVYKRYRNVFTRLKDAQIEIEKLKAENAGHIADKENIANLFVDMNEERRKSVLEKKKKANINKLFKEPGTISENESQAMEGKVAAEKARLEQDLPTQLPPQEYGPYQKAPTAPPPPRGGTGYDIKDTPESGGSLLSPLRMLFN